MSDKTTQEAMRELTEAWKDLMYVLAQPLIVFAKRVNLELKPWVKEREIRERWKDGK